MNYAYTVQCRSNDVEYINAFASFIDPHTVEAIGKDRRTGAETRTVLTADQFIVCTGGRPSYPDIPGAKEHCITSDDLFSMKEAPGKTLVVGGGYVALECAGFLNGLGFETTVMMRSVPLRGFDQQMAEHVVEHMAAEGVEFVRGATLSAVDRLASGKRTVRWEPASADGAVDGAEDYLDCEEFDTVLLAVGRDAYTHRMGLDKAGVDRLASNGKLPVTNEQTNVPHIYAIGDVIDGASLNPPSELTELTPVAIQAGRLLASRLYGGATTPMDYQMVPTTVFTPLEYGCVGYSEEGAIAAFGEADVEVFHQYFQPLEWRITFPRHVNTNCYAKLIVNTADNDRVVGLHVCGPHAGEMTQGFAVAMRCGATKADFDNTVGTSPRTRNSRRPLLAWRTEIADALTFATALMCTASCLCALRRHPPDHGRDLHYNADHKALGRVCADEDLLRVSLRQATCLALRRSVPSQLCLGKGVTSSINARYRWPQAHRFNSSPTESPPVI